MSSSSTITDKRRRLDSKDEAVRAAMDDLTAAQVLEFVPDDVLRAVKEEARTNFRSGRFLHLTIEHNDPECGIGRVLTWWVTPTYFKLTYPAMGDLVELTDETASDLVRCIDASVRAAGSHVENMCVWRYEMHLAATSPVEDPNKRWDKKTGKTQDWCEVQDTLLPHNSVNDDDYCHFPASPLPSGRAFRENLRAFISVLGRRPPPQGLFD